ncbi:pyridoxamine 5'-phosphate oxidase family protein [Amycolatopsis eburnea]|uniref:Pyridoxamine 5'-phosphate oxidase family protein n=1 Tax=Amycolatopsis eburnea TaxID=2267691 RepID=A0A427T8F0_9PSEU|nr:pyridoxamine 5'-phosphate oxidase family protein [Amycolatopsis eburnea]RSD16835.1 pyridoxamine 5'-phosphate oxidase family protein [Amycolatopsis eburnea]
MTAEAPEGKVISGYDAPAPSWELVEKGLVHGNSTYWLSTVRPDGRPHVMPLFGVWDGGSMYFTSNPAKRKAKNLAENPHCVITATSDDLDIVIEGTAAKVTDEAELRRVAELYHDKYGWPLTVVDGAYEAPFGAPTAGPPPYELYEVTVGTVFGLGTSEPFGSARWRFGTEES